ncbi:diguanylate cyclase domain-containing protein [Paludibaculum fermentans]|uniref:diguanylate cyclase domain-containing protein n=1 Tax=Paludibaculum fermentans TaxID=1473598 RepID=UPI003EC0CAAA
MGAIEIQVFVSLVVILGAAFVALICDFLKGSNEQLREANIVMRVREDERDKRDDLVEKVQQQTIEVVAKVQGALVGRPAAAPVPVAQPVARAQQTPAPQPAPLSTPVTDARELFERAQSERSARGRRGGRRSEERPVPPPRQESVASWAQDIVIRKHQEVEPKAPAVEPVHPVETAPAAAAQVSVAPAPMPLAVPVAQSTRHEFAAQPDQTGIPSAQPLLAQSEARVLMAQAQRLEQAPVAAPAAQAVPAIANLESPDAREMFAEQAQSKSQTVHAPALVDAQQPLTTAPVAPQVAAAAGQPEPAEVAAESILPFAQQPAAVCQLSQATELSLVMSAPAILSGSVASLPSETIVARTESSLPALQLHTEVPEFEIVPPSIEQFAQTVEPLATSEVPSAESQPLMVAAAEEVTLESATFEAPLVESTFETPVEVAEVMESPVLEQVEPLVPETVAAAAMAEVPETVEVADVMESPVLEQVESLVPETIAAAAMAEVPETVEVVEVMESPVLEQVESLVAETMATAAMAEVPETVEVAEVMESPVLEQVEALAPETAFATAIEEPAFTADYSLIEDMPVYAEIPTLARIEPELTPVVEPLVLETAAAAIFEPTMFESGADEEIQVVRIRVLRDDDVLPASEFTDTFLSLDQLSGSSSSQSTSEPEPVFAPLVAESPSEPIAVPEPVAAEMAATWPEAISEPEPVAAEMAATWPEAISEPEPVVAEMTAATWPEVISEPEPVVAEMTAATWPEAITEPEPVVAEMTAAAWYTPVAEAGPVVLPAMSDAMWAEAVAEADHSVAPAWYEALADSQPVGAGMTPETSQPADAPSEPSIWLTGAEPSTWSLGPDAAQTEPSFTEPTFAQAEPSFSGAASLDPAPSDDPFAYRPAVPEPVAQAPVVAAPQSEMRPKVVEMRSAAQARAEQEPPAPPTLVLPGGFHEPTALARLLEDEAPFSGLVIAVSVVDYVRLMADQGKPAIEQIMASVTRLVMSLTREQDFACRIAEDEFILIFSRENGASAKRRIQLVSERLWDYQLRSLGSVSIIFSWGASESQLQPIVQAVENAREQMLETRRNRRNLTGVSRRFGRQVANS